MGRKVAYSFGLLVSALSVTVFGQEPEYPIKPHPESQKLLEQWASPVDIKEHYALLAPLIELADENRPRFVQQLIYAFHALEREEMGKGLIFGRLFDMGLVGQRDIVTAVAPFLYGQHAKVRKLAQQLFVRSLGEPPSFGYGPGDLSYVVDALRSKDEEVSTPLKRAVFEVAPHSAFRVYLNSLQEMEGLDLLRAYHTLDGALFALRVNKRRALETGERSVNKNGGSSPQDWTADDRSIAALRELATSKHWWARMFASEFMVHNKDFRVPELIEKLEQDEHDLVRGSALSITTPDPLRAPVGPLRP